MSHHQQQPDRPLEHQEEAVKYGDVFQVGGELASKIVAPRDAAMMQTAENAVLGHTQKGGPTAAMQAAATANEMAGFVSHDDVSDTVKTEGVTVTETELPTARVVTHTFGGQVVGQFIQATPVHQREQSVSLSQAPRQGGSRSAKLTIGEALEAVAATTGDKPVEQCDATAIQAAEVRATGSSVITPGGLASSAQAAASINAKVDRDEDMIKLGDVLTILKQSTLPCRFSNHHHSKPPLIPIIVVSLSASRLPHHPIPVPNATLKLPADKEATREDAKGVMSAELKINPNIARHPAGVAASVLAAARLNEGSNP
ncbi:hypothetical protein KSS87_007995 [Heliosperma pusillum]|nr:hypothetical protein KSS87_007995 [Heliosperma pusillum]